MIKVEKAKKTPAIKAQLITAQSFKANRLVIDINSSENYRIEEFPLIETLDPDRMVK